MICVAGMPRSGTSLVTQLLHRCGVHLGAPEQLMPASINNTDGFWENLRFVAVNERLLAASSGSWFSPPATLRPSPDITAAAQSVIAEFKGQEPWAWKDPRNALTLPFWKSLLPSMKVLMCVRHPAETASSLAASTLFPRTFFWEVTRRDSSIRLHERLWGVIRTSTSIRKRRKVIEEVGLELWRIYNTSILAETREEDRIVVHYDAMLTNPRAELDRICDFFGIRVSDDAVQIVSPRLRHQHAGPAILDADLAAIYAELSRESTISTRGVRSG